MRSSHIYQVPTGGTLPTADGRVQMYPCFSFEFHLLLVAIDPDLGTPEIVRYRVGHDCGTQINPKIVRGMTMGGIAHGIGAALYEEFAYNDEGQLIAQTFMDYLLPSSHEVPAVEIIDHETPSPHTVLGQKGSGESGYLGAPAAIANAINDALRPLGISINTLPIKVVEARRPDRRGAGAQQMIVDCHAHLVPPDLLAAIRKDAAQVSQRAADRGRRLPRLCLCRRQADAAGVEAAVGYSGARRLDGTSKASTSRWSAAGSTCSAMSCRARKAKPGAGSPTTACWPPPRPSRVSCRWRPCRSATARAPPRCSRTR